ncbi:MAG: M16 family metallopeptidase [Burkholderiales bacterium]
MCVSPVLRVFAFAVAWCAAAPVAAQITIANWQTANGAGVYFVENHDLPMLDVSVEFPAGSGRDRAEKSGLAALTRHMLDQGAAGLTDDQIARHFADVGAVFESQLDQDRCGVRLRSLSSAAELDIALDTLAKVLQQPEFPQLVLEREIARVVALLKEEDTRSESIARKAFHAALYGSHPYGLPTGGNAATVAKLVRQDMVDFYRRYYRADRAVISMIGDISRERAERIAVQLSAGLPQPTEAAQELPEVGLQPAGLVNIDHPATQSHILMGVPSLRRDDPDYFALYVGNYILGGGGFVSRLMEEVRQKRGLAYSVYSYFMPLQRPGPFQIGLQTEKTQSAQALSVVRDTLRKFVDEGPNDAELAEAKQNLVGGFVLRIDTNKDILDYLAVIGFYRLPLTYLDDWVEKVSRVTKAEVKDAFARRVRPEAMATVVVGGSATEPAATTPGLSAE